MMKSAIDIGTNTVLLLVAEKEQGDIRVIEEQQRVPRLGRNVDEQRNLPDEAMGRVIDILKEYQHIIDRKYPDAGPPVVTATSAVRDANNRDEFIDRVEEQTGLRVTILSGLEEAACTFLGAQSVLPGVPRDQLKIVLDIGGGSTEIALGKEAEIMDRYSFDMGCVRFTERYLKDIPATPGQINDCKKAIREVLAEYPYDLEDDIRLVGVSGTVTSLVYIDRDLTAYDNDGINGCRLSAGAIRDYISIFRSATPDELTRRYPVVMEGRADIFLAGLLILEGVMDLYGFGSLIASTGGIRHGAVLLEGSLNKKSP
ncbi:Ppx/GppA phosphatase [Fodinibius roseus]|uniref:Ppx/GppA phosphatase n=1 Tax=Fodinibius roseus TaxID=1194090 RepID=A0A1M5C5C4_9BACT|nr:Ppx/GppA phosphatase family protein [Fodinibius roseus]SHF49836.1 Ppx/GppA phosphatase [Fodinibius roseus]